MHGTYVLYTTKITEVLIMNKLIKDINHRNNEKKLGVYCVKKTCNHNRNIKESICSLKIKHTKGIQIL